MATLTPLALGDASTVRLTRANSAPVLADIDTFIFDCDGVLFRGTTPIAGAADTLSFLRAAGKRLVFVTNNSTLSREAYTHKFAKLGITATADEIFTSSLATATYLKSLNFTKKVYVIGEQGVPSELDMVGIPWVGAFHDRERPTLHESEDELREFLTSDADVGAVVVGFDGHISYRKMARAFLSLQRPDTLFIATNADKTFPVHGLILPGGGTLVAAVETCSGRTATVMGKPNVLMLDMVARFYNIDRTRTMMIGDRLDTDVKFGRDGGVFTMLVESGVGKEADIAHVPAENRPHFVATSVHELMHL